MNETVGFDIADTARLLRRRFDERARLIGVTRSQWRALVAVARNEGITQGRLAEIVEVEPITTCRMVDRLEEAGHLERRRDPADRRAWNLFLTDKSRPLIARLSAIGDEVFAIALDGLDEEARAAFTATLAHIRRNLAAPEQKDIAHG